MWCLKAVRVSIAILVLTSCMGCILCRSVAYADSELTNNSKRINFLDSSETVEVYFKWAVKELLKTILPEMISLTYESNMSGPCMQSLVKMIMDISKAKMWAIKMLDSTSKVPPGILEGTLSDYGDYDECLDILVPLKNGSEDFRGQFCAVEAGPYLPPMPKNFSIAKIQRSSMIDTIASEVKASGMAMYYLQVRVGVCVPSSCSRKDVSAIANKVADRFGFVVKVPKCYVKGHKEMETLHIIVIFVIAVLIVLVITGTILSMNVKHQSMDIKQSKFQKTLLCFSFLSNLKILTSAKKSPRELRCLQGFLSVSIFWVIIGYACVWFNGQLVKNPGLAQKWISRLEFQVVLNSWLAADSFFLCSGIYTCVAAFKMMSMSSGKLDISSFLLHRFIRTTPPMLLVMSLVLFLPLVSSGPFWYEKVDPVIETCENYWWTNLLYIGNWLGMERLCVTSTWYFSAEFQMHILSLIVLVPLYRSGRAGLSIVLLGIVGCIVGTGAFIYYWDLPPNVQLVSADQEKITQTMDFLFIHTLPHLGAYYIGLATGYLILKHKEIKLSKLLVATCWGSSTVLCICAVFGGYNWNVGEEHGKIVTVLYGASHRCLFALGIAWVVFACATGYGGVVNMLLSSSLFAPLSRLTYLTYLFHALVILLRSGSRRERPFTSLYNQVYEFSSNMVASIVLAVICYLLLEAPLSNLEKLVTSSSKDETDTDKTETTKTKNCKQHFPNSTENLILDCKKKQVAA